MLQNLLYVAAALLLVLLNGFFVAAEFALVKLRHTQAATMGENHGWRGRVLVDVHHHLDAYLSACQLGITLASLALGWIGEPAFAHLLEPLLSRAGASAETTQIVSLVVAFTLISYLHIVLGELAPKSLAIRRPEAMSLWTAAPLYTFYWLMYPAIWLLNASANWMLRRSGVAAGDEEHGYTRDELKLIVHAQRENRAGEEYTMMKYALDLPELVVGDVMRTRDQLALLRDGMDRAAVLAEFNRSNYSRYPWFDANGDHALGILHMKDLLHAMSERADVEDMTSLLRPPILLPLNTPLLDVLKRFRAGDTHLALGVEDSGRVAGFLTLEDILEVLVGDIEDEGDAEDALDDEELEPSVDDELTISGGMPIYRLERLLDREIDAPADVNSVGGLIIHRLERLPAEGETLHFDGFDLTVRTMQGARAKTIVVHPHHQLAEENR